MTEKISIAEFLDGRDLDQLMRIQKDLNERIEKITAKPEKLIWRVCSGGLCHGNFRSEGYLDAVEFMARKARKLYEDCPVDVYRLRLSIDYDHVPESEYERWVTNEDE